MKKARKALSFLLCLVLIVGILPVSVLADEPDVAQVGAANIRGFSAPVSCRNLMPIVYQMWKHLAMCRVLKKLYFFQQFS